MVGAWKGNALSPGSPKNVLRGFHRDGIDSHPDWNGSGRWEEVNAIA